ncbi:MAG: molybdopterin-guanine dinucleotide biosynthesis protein B [Acetobacteraceae bacterium]|nr:molybdopterin-guanine dinucleotide biosynthesis protein B [Acetobacteraceae bacterium]MSP31041.1 molybdopterin-guanine dinucleotide biosynthesis protein B [Acetobacteraceae bacterium]
MRTLGIVGWSGSGKTTLITKLIPLLKARKLRISTIKHAHAGFEMDTPGKDSFRHREAGVGEVMVVSGNRWALLHETEKEPKLDNLLLRMTEADIILVEGMKDAEISKLEIHRPSLGKPPIWPNQPDILAVASDEPLDNCDRVVLPLNRPDRIVSWILRLTGLEITRVINS